VARLLRRARLERLWTLVAFPDAQLPWVRVAVRQGRTLSRARPPDVIVAFMMPYSVGLAGVLLKALSRRPLVLNFDDSMTCSDMQPEFETRLHAWLTRAVEDWYIRRADAAVFVSQRNLERVHDRLPPAHRSKLKLVRFGADPKLFEDRSEHRSTPRFVIRYTGGFVGWTSLYEDARTRGALPRLHRRIMRLGRVRVAELDPRTHSPVYLARAVAALIQRRPELDGKVHIEVYGNDYPQHVIDTVLDRERLAELVTVLPPVPHDEAAQLAAGADALFIALPDRADGSPGGRISAKTYEYLMTDRPIVAAVPAGENRDFLQDVPGVWLVPPAGVDEMSAILEELVEPALSGEALRFQRPAQRRALDYDNLAVAFEGVLAATMPAR
jgi:glycosyltransferase involved in cell wall biosynthesis